MSELWDGRLATAQAAASAFDLRVAQPREHVVERVVDGHGTAKYGDVVASQGGGDGGAVEVAVAALAGCLGGELAGVARGGVDAAVGARVVFGAQRVG